LPTLVGIRALIHKPDKLKTSYCAALPADRPNEGTVVDHLPDSIYFEFYDLGGGFPSGTIDLAAKGNDNYSTCTTCVSIYQDQPDGSPAGKIFFQSAGSLTLDPTPPLGDPEVAFSLNAVQLVEVTIDENFVSTPVPGGDCYFQVGDSIFANGFEAP
jgi:hypothetical protein